MTDFRARTPFFDHHRGRTTQVRAPLIGGGANGEVHQLEREIILRLAHDDIRLGQFTRSFEVRRSIGSSGGMAMRHDGYRLVWLDLNNRRGESRREYGYDHRSSEDFPSNGKFAFWLFMELSIEAGLLGIVMEFLAYVNRNESLPRLGMPFSTPMLAYQEAAWERAIRQNPSSVIPIPADNAAVLTEEEQDFAAVERAMREGVPTDEAIRNQALRTGRASDILGAMASTLQMLGVTPLAEELEDLSPRMVEDEDVPPNTLIGLVRGRESSYGLPPRGQFFDHLVIDDVEEEETEQEADSSESLNQPPVKDVTVKTKRKGVRF